MKFRKAILPALIFSLAVSCGTKKPIPTKIEFETDFNTALQKAKQSDMPMIIDFYTDWCRWCDSLDANTYVDPVVIGMSVDDIFVKINAEVDTALARQYGVSGFPTIVITDSDGKEIDRIWGYLPPTDFYNQIQLYFQGKETLDDYLTRLKDDPENLEYMATVAEKYAGRSMFEDAIKMYRSIIELDPDNAKGYGLAAWSSVYDTQERMKDYNGAIATCRDIIAKFPGESAALDAEAQIAYYTAKKGDNKEALKLYRQFVKKYPDNKNCGWIKRRIADLEDKQ